MFCMMRWVWIKEIFQHMFKILINKFEWIWSKIYNARAWRFYSCSKLQLISHLFFKLTIMFFYNPKHSRCLTCLWCFMWEAYIYDELFIVVLNRPCLGHSLVLSWCHVISHVLKYFWWYIYPLIGFSSNGSKILKAQDNFS